MYMLPNANAVHFGLGTFFSSRYRRIALFGPQNIFVNRSQHDNFSPEKPLIILALVKKYRSNEHRFLRNFD